MIEAIVTDIEGTTTALSFVKDVLFPYSRATLEGFLEAHADDPLLLTQIRAIEDHTGHSLERAELYTLLLRWIDEDQKLTPLKAIQGLQWYEGYQQAQLEGHLYEDAAHYLQCWKNQGIRLYVYSSGSVQAQQLLFSHTAWGDLTPLFSGFFDTNVGGKRDATSYHRIVKHLVLPAAHVLFLSDVVAELDAARSAAMQTCLVAREGQPDAPVHHPIARDFSEVPVTGSPRAQSRIDHSGIE